MSPPIDLVGIKLRQSIRREPSTDVDELVAEVERLRAQGQAILAAGGDFLWTGGAATLPETVAGVLHALDVELTRSMRERDQSPAAKVRDAHPHINYTDADLVKRAVERAGRLGPKMARWVPVGAAFSVGSRIAAALCRACGLDPDEMVGDDGEGEE